MLGELKNQMSESDALVMAAAVADVRPTNTDDEKIKKENLRKIEVTSNPDLLATMSKIRRSDQVLVGFAAETSNAFEELGAAKLKSKGVDLLYATNVAGGAVFGDERTTGSLLSKSGVLARYQSEDKFVVAKKIVEEISIALGATNG